MMKRIKGEIVFIDLEGGFWGIRTLDEKFFPVHMHEQLKSPGRMITCSIEVDLDIMTTQSWGTPCRIVTFTTS